MSDEQPEVTDPPLSPFQRGPEVADPGPFVPEPELVDAEVVVDGEVLGETAEEEGDLLSAEMTAAQAELDEYRDTLQRLKAEFDNYKRRVVREQTALVERASSGLIRELLPVLDAFEAALATPAETPAGLKEGLEKVWQQLTTVLGSQGLSRIADTGVVFDPQQHEAVVSEDAGEPGGPTVDQVLRSGWALKGQVLRPAMVKVRG